MQIKRVIFVGARKIAHVSTSADACRSDRRFKMREQDLRETETTDVVELGAATELTLGIPAQNRKENLVVEDYKN
jgi:hypothetical protein